MAGVLLEWISLEDMVPDLTLANVGIQCDNFSTVLGSIYLCRSSSTCNGTHTINSKFCTSDGSAHFWRGQKMVDVSSRFKSDSSLHAHSPYILHYFNSHFPQATSWQKSHLPSNFLSRVISSLWGDQLTLESWRKLPKPGKITGTTGLVTQMISTYILASKPVIPSSLTCASQNSLLRSGQEAKELDIKKYFKESLNTWQPFGKIV